MSAPAPDARLANYRLERLLGTGGMGSVYLARDLTLDRDVAIKFISPEKAGDDSARRRLIREARAAAALEHPNICAVHEVIVEDSGRACIVMQYVQGETLAEKLQGGALDARLAVGIASQLADALAAAHARGIVHRDLKPQNVILSSERRVTLLDFGIAHVTDFTTHTDFGGTPLTAQGAFVGTPPYMSPEQAQHAAVDGRSDLFSLGAVLFECLTGRRAFEGRTPLEVFAQVLTYDPPAVSSLRPELTPAFDEVCRRLLAKHPDDRFRSAEEVLGALRLLLPDTARSGVEPLGQSAPGARRWTFRRGISAAVSVAILSAIGLWSWDRRSLPGDTAAGANDWFQRGTEYVRDGAYHSAVLAMTQSLEASPDYAPAHLRMAEAFTELDDERAAQVALVRALELTPDPSRLPKDERLRIEALRALVKRDLSGAVAAYQQLAGRNPGDAGVWLDLGRAQEAFALTADALKSFEKAIQVRGDYAAAHLRRATLLASDGSRDEALKEFDTAERLYRAASNVEGEVETLIRRGTYLNGGNELKAARAALETALALGGTRSESQQIRARMQLSSVTASEGRLSEAETLATAAVQDAQDHGYPTIAADGLIDLANAMLLRKRRTEARQNLVRAITIADARGAKRIVARARIQQASIMLEEALLPQALQTAREALPFVTENHYRRYELQARSIIGRAQESLGNYDEATAMARDVLAVAEAIHDQAQAAIALDNLAGTANATGALPEALEYRLKAETIHRQQNDDASLAFDLTGRAELLIRMGRAPEAELLLREFDQKVANGIDAFKARIRRAQALRAFSLATRGDHRGALHTATALTTTDATDGPGKLALRIAEYAAASSGGRIAPAPFPESEKLSSPTTREIRYWALAAHLASGDAKRTLAAVRATLADPYVGVSPEFEWRVAAIGAAAAKSAAPPEAAELAMRAEKALDRVRISWKADVNAYLARPDLKALQRKAGLNIPVLKKRSGRDNT